MHSQKIKKKFFKEKEVTYYHVYHMSLVKQTNPGTIEKGMTQEWEQEVGPLGAILKADVHK